MALDFAAEEILSFQGLVTVEEDLQSYILEWPSVPDADGASEAIVVVLQKRQGGFLLSVPPGFVPEQVLARANAGQDAGPIGASTSVVVPGMLVDGGVRSLAGSQLEVVLVDVSADLVSQMRVAEMPEDIALPFDADNPFVLPSPQEVLAAAQDWIRGAVEGLLLCQWPHRGSGGGRRRNASEGGEAVTCLKSEVKEIAKGRRHAYWKRKTRRQGKESHDSFTGCLPRPAVGSCSNSVQSDSGPCYKASTAGESAGGSFKSRGTWTFSAPVFLSNSNDSSCRSSCQSSGRPSSNPGPWIYSRSEAVGLSAEDLVNLEEDKPLAPAPDLDLAKAMYAQSQAMTALVGQLTQSQQDPMMDLSSTSASSSTRGTMGRAKLQAELATHSGSFYFSVLRSMARRMQPTSSAMATPSELLRRGISGTLYMERFGGFGRHRDLGLILYQVMGIMDFLQADNVGAAKDAAALLAVGLDQAVLDGGRFDLAALLTLQEDPPSTIFVNRQQSSLSKARAFSPLADQRWVTVALAYIKELDVITTHRQELTGGGAELILHGTSRDPFVFFPRDSRSHCLPLHFLLPLPKLPACIGGGFPRLSRRRLSKLCRARLLHVTIFTLNFVYLGRYPTLEELGRRPTCSQSRIIAWLRSLLAVCGSSTESFSLAPGRSGPELGACLYQLEKFVRVCPELVQSYLDGPRDFQPDPGLFPPEKFPQLAPYRNLDAGRLRLVGEGKWRMQDYLDSSLWLPFVEPAFLQHGLEVDEAYAPKFHQESRAECMELMRVWDARGLLDFFEHPIVDGMFSRVFNAYKSPEADRQIGDRRRVNMSEFSYDGPSQWLPPGPLLTQLWVKRFQQKLVASVTDRRDFYHQAMVTDERARSNMLPFSYEQPDVCHLEGFQRFVTRSQKKKVPQREVAGDKLGQAPEAKKKRGLFEGPVFPVFRSLFQGDHLGVEFALCAHQGLLEEAGLLRKGEQILGRHGFPSGPLYSGLVYAREGLIGSDEKDIAAKTHFKAAGAEVISTPFAVAAGCVSVGAPLGKRLALSALSLRAAALPGLTPSLASRLAGNWTSCLLYRRCLASVVDGLFAFGVHCPEAKEDVILPLPRSISRELVVLSALSPLMCSNVAVSYLGHVFATDASLAKGAVVRADIDHAVCEEVWLNSELKGQYVMLESGFREILKHVGVGAVSAAAVELGLTVAPPLDLSGSPPHYDLTNLDLLMWVMHMIKEKRFRSFLVEPPCTTFSPAAYPSLRSYKEPYGFCRENPRVLHGNSLAFKSLLLLRYGKRHRCPCGLEQPRRSKMAWLREWISLVESGDFCEAVLAACMFGSIHQKEFRFLLYGLFAEEVEMRLNTADDPTREVPLRPACPNSIRAASGLDFGLLHRNGLKQSAANWIRLLVLLSLVDRVCAFPNLGFASLLDFGCLSVLLDFLWRAVCLLGGLVLCGSYWFVLHRLLFRAGCFNLLGLLICLSDPSRLSSPVDFRLGALAMEPTSAAERKRATEGRTPADWPQIRKQLAVAWDFAYSWIEEPFGHHPALPASVLLAIMSVAILWGWLNEAAVFGLAWCGILRIGEVLQATRADLVLPRDAVSGTQYALLKIREPKTRGRHAKHQAARVDPADVVLLLDIAFSGKGSTEKLWPLSAATLRRRFGDLMQALKLPQTNDGRLRPFDLSSFRPGGASHLLSSCEDSEVVRRRGRWATVKTMEIYLQEVLYITYVERLPAASKEMIGLAAASFPDLLQEAKAFAESNIPCSTWYQLLKVVIIGRVITLTEAGSAEGEAEGEAEATADDAELEGFVPPDIFTVDVNDIGEGFDWALMNLRFEVSLLMQFFRQDWGRALPGIHESHVGYYYNRCFRKALNPKLFGVTTAAEVCDFIKDVVTVDNGILSPVTEEQTADLEKLLRLTEEARRERQRRLEAGKLQAEILGHHAAADDAAASDVLGREGWHPNSQVWRMAGHHSMASAARGGSPWLRAAAQHAARTAGWIVQASEGYLKQRLEENLEQSADGADGADIAQLGEGVGDLLRQVGKCEDSQKYLEKSRSIREQQGTLQTPEGAKLLRNLGVVYGEQKAFEKGLKTLREAEAIRIKTGTLETSDGARLLSNIASLLVRRHWEEKEDRDAKDVDEALRNYAKAQAILEATGDDRTDEAAQLAFSEGNAYRVRGGEGGEGGGEEDLQSAMEKYEKAKAIRKENGTLDTPDGARLLYSLALLYHKRTDLDKTLKTLRQVPSLRLQFSLDD
eukprot:s2363_g10.t1